MVLVAFLLCHSEQHTQAQRKTAFLLQRGRFFRAPDVGDGVGATEIKACQEKNKENHWEARKMNENL
jgi:hypothetical protein